eukprot:9469279-Pyramimonas_sp.AAC.1
MCEPCGASYVVQAMRCKSCGVSYAVQVMWCKRCGVSYAVSVEAMRRKLCAGHVVQATRCGLRRASPVVRAA